MSRKQIKKRHHFASECYLRPFANESGLIWEFRKDDPTNPHQRNYEVVGFHKHYYAQPLPNGGTDHNSLENCWGEVESAWTPLVDQIRRRENIAPSRADLYRFLTMCRVRVPAIRDLVELHLAETVRGTIRHLDRMGRLPPTSDGVMDALEKGDIAIDPHRSIHAMPFLAKGFGEILARVGYEIVVNETTAEFVTSDNPVSYFDPRAAENVRRPYTIDRGDWCIELLFPIDPKHCLRAHSELGPQFMRDGITYRTTTHETEVDRINREIVRFGYGTIYSRTNTIAPIVQKFAKHSPIGRTTCLIQDGRTYLVLRQEFGPRPRKRKWKRAG